MIGLVASVWAGPLQVLAEPTCFDELCLPGGARVDVVDGTLRAAFVDGSLAACGTVLRPRPRAAQVQVQVRPDGFAVWGYTDTPFTLGDLTVVGAVTCVHGPVPRVEAGITAAPGSLHGWALPAGFEVFDAALWSFMDAEPGRRTAHGEGTDGGRMGDAVESMAGGVDACGAEWRHAQIPGAHAVAGQVFVEHLERSWRPDAPGAPELVGGRLARPSALGPLSVPAGGSLTTRGDEPVAARGAVFGALPVASAQAMFGPPPWPASSDLRSDCRVWTEPVVGWRLTLEACPPCPGRWEMPPDLPHLFVDLDGRPVDQVSAALLWNPTTRCTCSRPRRRHPPSAGLEDERVRDGRR